MSAEKSRKQQEENYKNNEQDNDWEIDIMDKLPHKKLTVGSNPSNH